MRFWPCLLYTSKVLPAATEGCYYIQNAVRGNYLEWYGAKDNWSSYTRVTDEALFAQAFYKVCLLYTSRWQATRPGPSTAPATTPSRPTTTMWCWDR